MEKNYRDPKNMEEAGIKGDDTLYNNQRDSRNSEKDMQRKYGHREDELPIMDGQNSQQGNEDRQEQFRFIGTEPQDGQAGAEQAYDHGQREKGAQLSGYNIAKSKEEYPEKGKKDGDSNPEKQADEFYQRYDQEDPVDKRIK